MKSLVEFSKVRQCSRLIAQIHLFADLESESIELLEDRPRHLRSGLPSQETKERFHEVEVSCNKMLDPGTKNLDRHDSTIMKCGSVNNSNRGLPNWCSLKGGVDLFEGATQIFLDSTADLFEGNTRSSVEA